MSQYELDTATTDLLNKGLKFTPTPPNNIEELKTDVHLFTKNIRRAVHFNNTNYIATTIDNSLVKNKSKFYPSKTENTTLENFVTFIENQANNIQPNTSCHNNVKHSKNLNIIMTL